MTHPRALPSWLMAPLLLLGATIAPLQEASAQAWPSGVAPYQRVPVQPRPYPWAYGDMVSDGSDSQPLTPVQMAQRCNTGRLVGGLLGGGLGYGLSRQDGRAWAIPLGALLGSQVGCSAAVGRGPLPW